MNIFIICGASRPSKKVDLAKPLIGYVSLIYVTESGFEVNNFIICGASRPSKKVDLSKAT